MALSLPLAKQLSGVGIRVMDIAGGKKIIKSTVKDYFSLPLTSLSTQSLYLVGQFVSHEIQP